MKILFAGGGTGGHFYPVIAIIRALREIAESERVVKLDILFMSDAPYDEDILRQENVRFIKVPAGKLRRYFSFLNIFDFFKIGLGILMAFLKMYSEMPDVVFSKGGYASFPALFAARVLRIPTIIHESDVVPGKANRWAASFARRIAISFAESLPFFPKEKVALTGNPIRKQIVGGNIDEAREFFDLESETPVILIFGGSQGSEKINNTILDILLELASSYQIIHQCGRKNLSECKSRAAVIFEKSPLQRRYHAYGAIGEDALRNASRAADLVISRAGASAIFEIAAWGLPSILIPLKNSAQDHQRENAYAYARGGACIVIEEVNLSPHLLLSEIQKITGDPERRENMKAAALSFSKIDAAEKMAREIIRLALEHAV